MVQIAYACTTLPAGRIQNSRIFLLVKCRKKRTYQDIRILAQDLAMRFIKTARPGKSESSKKKQAGHDQHIPAFHGIEHNSP